MKKSRKFILPALALVLILSLAACGKKDAGSNEKPKETATETINETDGEKDMPEDDYKGEMHQGIYLGNGLFLGKMKNEKQDGYDLMYVTTPDNSKLEIGKTYEYNVYTVLESMPGQTTVKEIKEVENNEITKIDEITASLLQQYVDTEKTSVNLMYQSSDKIVKDSLVYNKENTEKLDKNGVLMVYGKDSEKLAKMLKEEGFKLVFDLGELNEVKELELQ